MGKEEGAHKEEEKYDHLAGEKRKKRNANKPEDDISRTKFHNGRSYYGKELLQQSRRLYHILGIDE